MSGSIEVRDMFLDLNTAVEALSYFHICSHGALCCQSLENELY